MTPLSVRTGHHPADAPWVRTRLRTAPGTAWALALLVLVTSFLAALFPRAVEHQGIEGLHHDITAADAGRSVLELRSPQPSLQLSPAEREAMVRGAALKTIHDKARAALPAEVRPGAADSAYGFRTSRPVPAPDTWLPRPEGIDPELTYTTLSGLPRHAMLRSGAWPAVRGTVTEDTGEVEGVVTEETAKALGARTGATISVPTRAGEHLTVRITGIVAPREPGSAYWSAEPLFRTPALVPQPAKTPPGLNPPRHYWTAAVLLAPDAAPALLGSTGEPEMFWRFAPDVSGLTAADVPGLRSALASLENGPGLVRLRAVAGDDAAFRTELDQILAGYDTLRAAIDPVMTVAAVGVGAVAAVVLLMTAGLIGGRRREELALLRARGGSLAGLGGRLLAETAVVAVPAAALGLLAALPFFGAARTWPSVTGPVVVAVLVCAAVPVGAVLPHRRPRLPGARDDLMDARPSRLRTVAELTVLVLAVGAVAGLRRRGTTDGGDLLLSAAPVLVGLIAALVLVRLLPWPLRLASRAVARRRGAVGFLSLARAGRSSAGGALPLLALLLALTTAAFGGSVLAGIADARDRAAVLTVGADARISGMLDAAPLPARLIREIRATGGVRQVAEVQVVTGVPLPPGADGTGSMKNTVVLGVDPDTYAQLARTSDLGAFPAGRLRAHGSKDKAGSAVVPVIASPSVAAELGDGPRDMTTPAGDLRVRVAGTLPRTAAVPDHEFLLVDTAALTRQWTTTLLVAGEPDPKALRATVRHAGKDISVRLRAEERATFVDTPMQRGARGIYAAAIVAGAGYALLAVLLSLLRTAPERTALLARLRTMGLTPRQGRRLLGLESLPQALPAAFGGVLVGWATIVLLAPGVDLVGLALFAGPGPVALDTAQLRADPWSLTLPALGVVVLTAAVATVQARWAGRRGPITELRSGDPR